MENSTVSSLGTHYQASYDYLYVGVALLLGLAIYNATKVDPDLAKIPAIGGDGIFSSWLGALRTVKNGNDMILEGYNKYKHGVGVFRVPLIQRWQVVVTSREHTEEMARAQDDEFSSLEAAKESIASEYTFGANSLTNTYHVNVVRNAVNKNLGNIFPVMHDELVHAFEDILPVTDDWVRVPVYKTALNIVARSSARVFVGIPKCRDPDYLELSRQHTIDVIIGSNIINLFPKFLKPLAGRLFTRLPSALERAIKHLQPIIHERQQKIKEYGSDYPDKPNDVLSWLMDAAEGEETTIENLTLRMLSLNFAAIHTSSSNFIRSLYHLASQPEYLKPLREEVEAVISKEGWSKTAISRMRKLDSFIKESMRVSGGSSVTLLRKAMKPYTFSDGLHIPKGTLIGSVLIPRSYDEEVYPGGATFDGFRFSDLGEDACNSTVSTNAQWIAFGLGRHACPGRFFAVMEIKVMLAFVVLNYDVKMENEGVMPPNENFNLFRSPSRNAEVLFRRRQAGPKI